MAKATINFGKAPPVNKSSTFDLIPQGYYLMSIRAESRETSGDDPKPSIPVTFTVEQGKQKGRRVGKTFVIPTSKKDSLWGIQLLHGLMVASGIKEQDGIVEIAKVVKGLNKEGRTVVVGVRDGRMPARGDFPERDVSQPDEFLDPDSKAGKQALGSGKASTNDDDDDDSDDDDDDDEKPSKKAKADEDDDDDDEPKVKSRKSSKDDDDDDDDDEEEKPKKGKKAKDDDFDDEDDD